MHKYSYILIFSTYSHNKNRNSAAEISICDLATSYQLDLQLTGSKVNCYISNKRFVLCFNFFKPTKNVNFGLSPMTYFWFLNDELWSVKLSFIIQTNFKLLDNVIPDLPAPFLGLHGAVCSLSKRCWIYTYRYTVYISLAN